MEITVGIVALLIALASAYFTWQNLWPGRRVLDVSIVPPQPLISEIAQNEPKVEISVDGKQLVGNPYLVSFSLTSTGRHDIPSAAFDQQKPLTVDIGAPVAKVLGVVSSPPQGSEPTWSPTPQGIEIGPTLISRGQSLSIQMICTEEPQADALRVRRDLIDVEVRTRQESPGSSTLRSRRGAIGAAVSAFFLGVAIFPVVLLLLLGSVGRDLFEDFIFPPQVEIVPERPSAGSGIELQGTNYGEGDEVVIHLQSEVDVAQHYEDLCWTTVGPGGDFALRCRLPEDIRPGPAELTVAQFSDTGLHFQYVDIVIS